MTEIIKAGDKNAIQRSLDVLNSGGIVIYPTETCYGIGADATNDKAVAKIGKIKKRPAGKHISIAFPGLKMAKNYLVITKNAEKLTKEFMPGPLTLVVQSKTSPASTIGFRIPDSHFARKLIKTFGKPITSTSANVSGKGELYSMKEVAKTFDGLADLIIDAGTLKRTKPSTVYDVANGRVLRKGPVTERRIKHALA